MGAFDDLLPPGKGAFSDLVPASPTDSGRVVATTPDGGRVVEYNDGRRAFTSPGYATSDPGQIGRIMDGAKTAAVAKAGPVATDGNTLRQAFQGLTVGAGDEITAYLTSLAGGTEYGTELDRERARLATGSDEAPLTSLAANVAGGLFPGAAVYSGITKGVQAARGAATAAPGLLAKMGLGAAAGAVEGGAYGFNSGEGGAGERLDNAADTGVLGAAVGGATPAVIAAARPTLRGMIGVATQPFNKSANPVAASRLVERAVNRSGMAVDDLDSAIQAALKGGQPTYALADALGPSGRSTLNAAVRQPGAAKAEAVEFLAKRQAGQSERLSSALADALGATDTAAQRTAALTASRDAAADAAFDAARASARPVDVRGVLAAIDDRLAPTRGVDIDPDGIDASLTRFRNRLASRSPATDDVPGMGRDPGATAVELSDFNKVFRVRKDMRDAREAAIRAGAGEKAKEIKAVIDAMDEALAGASDEYRAAMADYAKASGVIGAVDAGSAAAAPRVRSQDTLREVAGLTPEARDAYRAGYADPLLAAIQSGAPGANKARPLQSDKRVAELSELATDPEQLLRFIQREADMFATGNRVMGGSATADNLADAADQARGSAHLVGEAVINPVWALRRGLGNIADYAINGATGQNEATRALVARQLLGSDARGALQPAADARRVLEVYDNLVGALSRTSATRAGGPE